MAAPSAPFPPPPLLSLFSHDRFSTSPSSLLLLLFAPIALPLLLFRIALGFHAFVVACLLRKANWLRSYVLRVMCGVCGIVVTSSGQPDASSSRVVVSNHVTHLDHLAIDLLHPCVLASVWNIPNLLRWCFGYVDLGASEGRQELVNRAKKFVQADDSLPLLAFPESALTSGKVGMLRFATWPFEVAPSLQPVSIRVSRPLFGVECSVLGSAWWQDLLFFLALPATIIHVTWLPVMRQEEGESVEAFAARVSRAIGDSLSIVVTEYSSHDAVDAAKKHLAAREAAAAKKPVARSRLPPGKLDAAAMAIKQAYPSIAVVDIRRDLEMTHDPNQTIDRIKTGVLKPSVVTNAKKGAAPSSQGSPAEWRKLFDERKWALIEANRAKYLSHATRSQAAGDQ